MLLRPRPLRLKLDTVLKESPLTLTKESIWRVIRSYRGKRMVARLREPFPVVFRNIPYYRPNPENFSDLTRDLTIRFAGEICNGRFPFMGYGTATLGPSPKWNADFRSGVEWPQVQSNQASSRHAGSDVKVPYELSRLQFLPILGKAYVITGDDRYRQSGKEILVDWIRHNPVLVGINWTLAMEAALRAMSICFMLNLLWPLRPDEQTWLQTVTRSLWEHLTYIEAHLELSYLTRSNHYLSNLLGGYCLSLFLEGKGMSSRRDSYRRRLEQEVFQQVFEDGGDHEASLGYHALVMQMFTTALLLMRADGARPSDRFQERVRLMHRMADDLANCNGELPQMGDCDDGRVELLLDDVEQMLLLSIPERNSLRLGNLLGLGSALFGGHRRPAEDAKWYGLTVDGPRSPSTLPREVNVFPDSGIAAARIGDTQVILFAVPNGISGKGSHTHNDKLSFVLRVDGQEVFTDSGTGCYTADLVKRNYFRSTEAHNTIALEGAEQNEISSTADGVFRIGNEARVSPIKVIANHDEVSMKASHHGYRRMGVVHSRTVRILDGGHVLIEDQLVGTGRHRFALNFHLAPGWTLAGIENRGNSVLCRVVGIRVFDLMISGVSPLFGSSDDSLMSRSYGSSFVTTRLRIMGEADFPLTITSSITTVRTEVPELVTADPASTRGSRKLQGSHDLERDCEEL